MNFVMAAGENPLSFLTQFGVEWNLLVSQAISFALVAAALYYFAFKPVIAKANERKSIIEKGLKDADEARKRLEDAQSKADATLAKAAQEASETVKRARDDAKRQIEEAATTAAAKAAEIRAKAQKQLEEDKVKMREELKAELAQLVVQASEAAVGEILTAQQRSKLAEIAADKLAR